MTEYTDPFSLVSDTNDLLDKIAKEKIKIPSGKAGFETTIKKIETQKKNLEELREEMLRFGFDAPYKHLSEIHESLSEMKRENPNVYKEEISTILAGLKVMRYEAFVKSATIERIRTAINAHNIAIAQLKELQTETIFDNVLNYNRLGGDWEVKLDEMGGFSKMAYFRLIDLMSRVEEHTEAIVDFIVEFEDGNEIEEREKLPATCNIDEELKKKYGNKIEILRVTLTGEKRGIIKDQYSRTNLAFIFTKSTYEMASQRTVEELRGKIDEDLMEKYDSILRKIPLHEEDGSISSDEVEKLKDALDDAKFLNEKGEVKQEIIEQNVFRARTLVKNYHIYSWSALAKNLFLYYLTKSRKDRSEAGLFPGTKIELKDRDFELFEILENGTIDVVLKDIGLPRSITGAAKALKEKLDKEVKSKVPAKYLGGLSLFAHTDLTLGEICELLNTSEDKLKEHAVQSGIKFSEEKEKELKLEIKTKKAKEFVKALKGE
ncbi:MAG: DUF530 family protein [Candidatus Diapherotrites archaeon]|nr:DUF530 family protein [Candidatus Diapherotrites archaeon]